MAIGKNDIPTFEDTEPIGDAIPSFDETEPVEDGLKKKEQSDKESTSLLATSNPLVSVAPSTSSGKAIVTPSGGTDKFKEHLKNSFQGVAGERGFIQHNAASDAYINSIANQGYSQADVKELKKYKDKIAATTQKTQELTQALKQNPEDRQANYLMGTTQLDNGDANAALNFFTKALTSKETEVPMPTQGENGEPYPQKPFSESDVLYGIASAQHKLGNEQDASEYYQEALKADPNNANAAKGVAPILYKQGNVEGAKELLAHASQIDKEKNKLQQTADAYHYEKAHENDTRDYLNGIADAIQHTVMSISPVQPVINGIEEGVKSMKEAPIVANTEGALAGTLKLGQGLAQTLLGVAMATPEGMVFNAASNAAELVTPEGLVSTLMNPVSTALNYLDINPSEGTKAAASILDIVAQGLMMKKGAEALGEKFKKNEPLTKEEFKKFQEVIPEITSDDLLEATKVVNEAKPELKDNKLQKLTKQSDELKQAHDALPEGEAKQIVATQLADTQKAIEDRGQAVIDEHQAKAVDAAVQVETQHRIADLQTDLSAIPEENKAARSVIESQITELNKQLNPQEHEEPIAEQLSKRLSPEEEQGMRRGGEINERATDIVNSIQGTGGEIKREGGKLIPSQERLVEEGALEEFAKKDNAWIENEFGEPDASGKEQDVYFNKDGKSVTKVNSNDAHGTWKDFFDRIAMHNALFPDVAYTVKGFTNHKGLFSVVMEQPFVKGKELGFHEIKGEMNKLGFDPMFPKAKNAEERNTFINKEKGVIIKDLHGENVIRGDNGRIHFIDPVIEFTKERKTKNLQHAVQIKGSGEIPVQPETRSSEGVRSENNKFQEPSGKSEVKEEKSVRQENKEIKLRALEKRILNSSIPEEVKQGMKEKGIGYIPEKVDINESQAKEMVNIYDEEGKLDELASKVMNQTNDIKPAARGALTAKLGEHYMDKADAARESGDFKLHQEYRAKMVEIADFAAKAFTEAGQFTAIGGMLWKKMLGKYPDLVIEELKKKLKVDRDKSFEGKEKNLKEVKTFIDEFLKSEEFENIVGERVKNELSKLAEKSTRIKRDNIFNSKEVRDKRKEELRQKWKDAGKSGLSSTIIGLNKEQIEVIGEMGAIYLAEGAHNFAKWAKKMAKEFEGITEDQLEHVWKNVKLPKELDEKERSLKEFAAVGRFEKMSKEEKGVLLDKLSERVKGMSDEKKKQFLADIIDEVDKLGGLTDERFKELYAKAMGLPHLTDEAQQHIYELSKTISEADKAADEYDKLYNEGASKEILKSAADKFDKLSLEARYANDRMSDYFRKEKTFGDVVSAAIQGNLMTTITALTNIIGNLSKAFPIAPAIRGVASGMDYALSKAAKLPLLNKLISEKRTIDAVAYWRGSTEAAKPSIKRAAREVIRGSTGIDPTIRDTNVKIQPKEAWVSLIAQLTGDKKLKINNLLRDFVEGTGGASAEAMFRVLNFGDKIFTGPAEEGYKSEMASLLGLTGTERDKFMKFTPEEAQKVIDERSQEYTFQNKSILAEIGLLVKKAIFTPSELSALKGKYNPPQPIKNAGKIAGSLIIPYVKTPANVMSYMVQLSIPEIALARGVFQGLRGNRRESLEALSTAIVGYGIRVGVQAAIKNNLITPLINDDDTPSEKAFKLSGADIKPGYINLTGFKRMLAGENTAYRDGDHQVAFKYFGLMGVPMALNAKTKEDFVNEDTKSYVNEMYDSFKGLPKSVLEQTFLAGLNTTLAAMNSPTEFQKLAVNTTVALSTAMVPNTLAQLSKFSQADLKDIKVTQGTSWEKFTGTLKNTFKERMFMGEDLPSRVNIWGNKVSRLPEGADPSYKYMYGLFDMYKPNKVDPNSFEYKLYKAYDDAPESDKAKLLPSQPARGKITVDGQKVPITEKDYENLSIYIGQARKSSAEEYILSDEFNDDDIKTKIKKLKSIYIEARDAGKQAFLEDNPQIEDLADIAKEE